MILTKEHIDYLSLFKLSAEKGEESDKIKLVVKDGKFYMSLHSHSISLFIKQSVEDKKESFDVVYPVKEFYDFLKTSQGKKIEINGKKIKIGKGNYQFDPWSRELRGGEDIEKMLSTPPIKTYEITDLRTLQAAKTFVGTDDMGEEGDFNQENVSLMENHWVASDTYNAAIIQTSNDIQQKININTTVTTLLKAAMNLKLIGESVEFNYYESKGEKENHWHVKLGDLNIVVIDQEVNCADFFNDEDIQSVINHKNKCVVDREALIEVLKKMKYFAMGNNGFRIYLNYLSQTEVSVETRDFNVSKEIITATIDKALVGQYSSLNCINLLKILNIIPTEEIYIWAHTDSNDANMNRAVKIEDPDRNYKMILTVFQD